MRFVTSLALATTLALLVFILMGCPGKLALTQPPISVISMSEIAEAVASGAVDATISTGSEARYIRSKNTKVASLSKIIQSSLSLLPQAQAATATGTCPTIQTPAPAVLATNSACGTNSPTNTIETLTWGPCTMAQPTGTWSGGQTFTITATTSNTTFSCSGFPTFASGDVITRVFFAPTSRIADNMPAPAVTVLVDTSGTTLVPVKTGYKFSFNMTGETITFSGPVARSIVVNGVHLKGSVNGYIVWDFTVSSAIDNSPPLGLSVDSSNIIQSGSLYVQDNINHITTQSVFNGVAYNNGCGTPSAGTITSTATTAPGDNPYTTETLAGFSNATCGTATLAGGVSNVTGTNINLVHVF